MINPLMLLTLLFLPSLHRLTTRAFHIATFLKAKEATGVNLVTKDSLKLFLTFSLKARMDDRNLT